MPDPQPGFVAEMQRRGLLHDATPGLAEHLAERAAAGEPAVGYIGFDPTADSLHVGSLVGILALARLQRAGHRPVALVGGGTGLIGDPSGKASERTLLDREQIAQNIAGIRAQLERFLDFDGPAGARVLDNADWLAPMSVPDFLRDVGKFFTVSYMTAKDSVKSRLEREDGLSFTEFSYMLLQAYDFAHLHRTIGCTLQMGGSDQWGNITAGTELLRKAHGAKGYGLTFPLVTSASGTKFGKTEAGTVWLDARRTSPYQFYQFWLNTDDADAERYLHSFTFLGADEIAALRADADAAPRERPMQRALARDVTGRVHGQAAVEQAERAAAALFGGEVSGLPADEIADVLAGAPSVDVPAAELAGDGLGLFDALVRAGLARSNGEARRLVQGGGVSVNDVKQDDLGRRITLADAVEGRVVVLRKGRKAYALLRAAR